MPRIALATILLFCVVGCATTRIVTITTKPPDATIKIDGMERGRGPIEERFIFNDASDVRRVAVNRPGFRESTVNLTRDFDRDSLLVELKPQSKRVNFNITPVPATLYVDGRPIATDPVATTSVEMEFSVDARNNWIDRAVRAERPGFVAVEIPVKFTDREPNYILKLEPMRKNVRIVTNPPGAQVFVDGEAVGVSPVNIENRPFAFDVDGNAFVPQTVKAVKAGFDPVEEAISWDDGKTDYAIDLAAKAKTVRILTDPPGGVVIVDGKELPRDPSGVTTMKFTFPPVNDGGELRTYAATIGKKTEASEWYPANLTIGWDGGQTDYQVRLKEIVTVQVPLLRWTMKRGDSGWLIKLERAGTIAAKDVTEGPSVESPLQMTQLPRGSQLDSLIVSPDGRRLLFTLLAAGAADDASPNNEDFRSQIAVVSTDGSGAVDFISDGKSLDLMPSFSPGGDSILFSSNRAGRRLSVWTMSAVGAPGITNLTSGESNDLWPNLDSEPKPRLFYQSMIDTRPDPRIFSTQLGTVSRTDLTSAGGMQPRINPKGDTILFSAVNEKTGKRDLFRMTDRGGAAENLTNTPDIDEFDAVWNKDGGRIAFVSDRGVDADGRHQLDVWILDPARPDQPTQVTSNASHDDCPAWDGTGRSVYFRSNRGGAWNVWRIATP